MPHAPPTRTAAGAPAAYLNEQPPPLCYTVREHPNMLLYRSTAMAQARAVAEAVATAEARVRKEERERSAIAIAALNATATRGDHARIQQPVKAGWTEMRSLPRELPRPPRPPRSRALDAPTSYALDARGAF